MNSRRDEDFDWEKQVGAQPLRLRPANPRLAVWMGYLISQIVGFGALALVTLIFTRFNWSQMGDLGSWTGGILGFSQFFLIPFGMGLVASYFWLDTLKIAVTDAELRNAQILKRKRPIAGVSSLLNTLLSCFGAFFILREGAICLIMASPILWLFMWIGVVAGDHFWRKNPFLGVSLAPLFFAEAGRPQAQEFAVSTDFHSKASPQALWRYTADYPRNPHAANWWLFRMGLPAPLKSTGTPEVGGRRDCDLTDGITVGQKIVVAETNRRLEFVIDKQPQHPELARHFILRRGRIELFPDGRGGTVIRGTSWYQLNVAPVAYFQGWSAPIVHQTHARVFAWMDELARRDAAQTLVASPVTSSKITEIARQFKSGQ